MKKKVALLFLVLLIGLSGCHFPREENSVCRNGRTDLFIAFEHSVPFVYTEFKFTDDMELYPLEADAYGRTLGVFCFTERYPSLLFGIGKVYCVIQTSEMEKDSFYGKGTCGFYEDCCCAIVSDESREAETIESLKRENDWDQPLQQDRICTIPFELYYPTGAYEVNSSTRPRCNPAIAKALHAEKEELLLDVVCQDRFGRILIAVQFKRNSERQDKTTWLFMMYENELLDQTRSVWEIQNPQNPWEEIKIFKETNGWNTPIDA